MSTQATLTPRELTDEERAMVQLSQADQLTMQGHVRNKLKLGRERLAKAWGVEESEGDSMQLLCRDVFLGDQRASVSQNTETSQITAPPAAPVAPVTVDEAKIAKDAADAAWAKLKEKLKEHKAKEAATRPRPTTPAPPPVMPQAEPSSWNKYLWPAIAGGALLAGSGGTALYNYVSGGPDTDTQYEFSISSEKGNGFSTGETKTE